MRPIRAPLLLAALVAVVVDSCASGGAGTSAPSPTAAVAGTTASGRPSSPAKVEIMSPTQNEVITGKTVHVVVKLTGATVVQATTTNITPPAGHVHLYLDNTLVYMQYSLQQDLPVNPGTYVLKAEFVASDHAPFDPRVWSEQVFFTVK